MPNHRVRLIKDHLHRLSNVQVLVQQLFQLQGICLVVVLSQHLLDHLGNLDVRLQLVLPEDKRVLVVLQLAVPVLDRLHAHGLLVLLDDRLVDGSAGELVVPLLVVIEEGQLFLKVAALRDVDDADHTVDGGNFVSLAEFFALFVDDVEEFFGDLTGGELESLVVLDSAVDGLLLLKKFHGLVLELHSLVSRNDSL